MRQFPVHLLLLLDSIAAVNRILKFEVRRILHIGSVHCHCHSESPRRLYWLIALLAVAAKRVRAVQQTVKMAGIFGIET